mmetsp:Transcript_10672/g.19475  ORF Transcript_10672/g.19475 Transcript_10672/m.19475 type:complete len:338 (-) Transcript_10672:262-1275(-)
MFAARRIAHNSKLAAVADAGGAAAIAAVSRCSKRSLCTAAKPKPFPCGHQPLIFLADAFTKTPFHGNPAAVTLIPQKHKASEKWMQSVAMEMNQAETAFVSPIEKPDKKESEMHFDLRWFTPLAEVDLCGHATLATAKVLVSEGHVLSSQTIHFHTRSGVHKADFSGSEGELQDIMLTFPREGVRGVSIEDMDYIAETFKAKDKGPVPIVWMGETRFDYFIELASPADVSNFQPDLESIQKLNKRGVIVTAKGNTTDYDYICRFFAPQIGIPEDPVTGSAHCALAPYWMKKLGKGSLMGYQASKRGGLVNCTVLDDNVLLQGGGVVTMKGELQLLVL